MIPFSFLKQVHISPFPTKISLKCPNAKKCLTKAKKCLHLTKITSKNSSVSNRKSSAAICAGIYNQEKFSFGDIFLFIGDIILSFGDNFLFFGNISSNFKIRHKNIIFANFISRIHTNVTNRIAMKQERMYLCCINHKG